MIPKQIATLLLGCTLLSGCVIHLEAKNANIEEQKTIQLDVDEINQLAIDAGAGKLTVQGVAGIEQIVVDAVIYTTKERDFALSLTHSGTTATLVAKHNTHGIWHKSPTIDVHVKVPQKLLLDINDGSGEMIIRDMNNHVTINDDSGAITIETIKGDVRIDDGTGSINAQKIVGDLIVHDGSGAIDVNDVTGMVNIDDGSGAMRVENVTGMVTIDDGSGAISVENTGGLVITDAGSGGLSFHRIHGEVKVNS